MKTIMRSLLYLIFPILFLLSKNYLIKIAKPYSIETMNVGVTAIPYLLSLALTIIFVLFLYYLFTNKPTKKTAVEIASLSVASLYLIILTLPTTSQIILQLAPLIRFMNPLFSVINLTINEVIFPGTLLFAYLLKIVLIARQSKKPPVQTEGDADWE